MSSCVVLSTNSNFISMFYITNKGSQKILNRKRKKVGFSRMNYLEQAPRYVLLFFQAEKNCVAQYLNSAFFSPFFFLFLFFLNFFFFFPCLVRNQRIKYSFCCIRNSYSSYLATSFDLEEVNRDIGLLNSVKNM